MDVDDNPANQQKSQQQTLDEADIEQSFLQQFSCLGTTDHDELVGRFQKLLGNQLNYTTARFFLDMNNWNLPAAVGCYFDFYSGQKLPSMQIVADVTIGEGESVTPNTTFQQAWKVQNNGDERWPDGCYLKCTSSLELAQIPVPALNPGESNIITITLVSPNECGSFQTKWRLCTPNGSHFGDTIWAIVLVQPTGTLAITQQLSELHTTTTTTVGGGGGVGAATSNFITSQTVPIPLPAIPVYGPIPQSMPSDITITTANLNVNMNNDDNEMC